MSRQDSGGAGLVRGWGEAGGPGRTPVQGVGSQAHGPHVLEACRAGIRVGAI